MAVVQGLLACLGRIMIATIFVLSAVGNKIPKFNDVATVMAAKGLPQTLVLGVPLHKLLLVGAIVFLIAGGLSVAAGYKARLGSLLLLIFLGAATYFFHDFWNAEPERQPAEMIQFLKNMALAGTMLFLIANGAGPGSLDRRQKPRRRLAAAPSGKQVELRAAGQSAVAVAGTGEAVVPAAPSDDAGLGKQAAPEAP